MVRVRKLLGASESRRLRLNSTVHVVGMDTHAPAVAETADPAAPAAEITAILKEHYSAGDGCSCGQAPEVFYERELHAHIADLLIGLGWVKQP